MAAVQTRSIHAGRSGAEWGAQSAAWIAVYALVAIAPLVFAVVDAPAGRGFWRDLSVALGFVGLAMLGLQFAITARIRPVTSPYGLDAVLQYHRLISIVATVFIVAHPTILVIRDTAMFALFNPVTAPWWRERGSSGSSRS